MKQSLLMQRGAKVRAAKKTSHVQRLLKAQRHKERPYNGCCPLPKADKRRVTGACVTAGGPSASSQLMASSAGAASRCRVKGHSDASTKHTREQNAESITVVRELICFLV